MNPAYEAAIRVVVIGIGATAAMDLWALLMKQFDVPSPNFALVGRWVGHMARGRWMHASIARSEALKGESALGWFVHYGIGIAFAGLLVGLGGPGWIDRPTLTLALGVGVGTVVAPLFVMQPAMGAGSASRKTPAPLASCIRSLANHTVFGVGLYLAALSCASVVQPLERFQP
jgi:hypothetical protein